MQEIEAGLTDKVYKMVFLDFSMPEMDGPETARKIRTLLQEQQASIRVGNR